MLNEANLLKELQFKALRSSGAGGQHVNKVSSKIELSFNLKDSLIFNENQKVRLLKKLENRLTKDGFLILSCDTTRSQHKNKGLVIKRLMALLESGLKTSKKRIPTKTPKAIIKKRLNNKKAHSEKKINRKKPNIS
ncbi:alternative ribosome rescue aminoacyl-tRNA hydrolase ArfB [Gaetbulibacter saemankumensis]|uniref:alternative ribosome rescue aminoacyl-tRNA hydrolase ArfB n=1 Tax=Gaetbulibacter saemankumensis TaxID=311208 RepID=UPI000425C9A9|nr:alternative ribosome rescue aminoacyl-tRNA hydrolase ArfB [Gaetbulibacter saemankumensis]